MAVTNRNASLLTKDLAATAVVGVGGGPSSQRPANPILGYLYYDTTLAYEVVWNGVTWLALIPTVPAATGYGTTAGRPTNPRPGFLYWDTTEAAEFAYTGVVWTRIGPTILTPGGGGGSGPEPPATVPAQPTTLSTVVISASQINLTWISNSAGAETGFDVEKSTDGVTYFQISTVASGTVTYASTGLQASTLYYYRVRAFNTVGFSNYTNVSSASTSAAPAVAPNAPVSVVATTASSTQINLTWASGGANPQSFSIARSSDNVNFTVVTSVNASTLSYSDVGLSASTQYWYKVLASNGAGNSAYSSTATATTAAPAAPAYSLVFSSFNVLGVVSETAPLIGAFITHDAAAGSTVLATIQALSGTVPPGVTLYVVAPDGTVLDYTTSEGGEAQLGLTFPAITNGGYSVVIVKSGDVFGMQINVGVASGTVLMHNCSARANIYGNQVYQTADPSTISPTNPGGLGLGLNANGTTGTAATTLLADGGSNTLLSQPNFSWALAGDTANNPVALVPSGLIISSCGCAAAVTASVRLEIDNVG